MRWKLLLIGVVLVAAAVYFGAVDMPRRGALYSADGKVAPGVITEKMERPGRRFSKKYSAQVQFKDASGVPQSVRNDFPRELWDTLAPGKKVQVRYLASDPQFAFAQGASGGQRRDPTTDMLIVAGLALGGVVVGGFGLMRR